MQTGTFYAVQERHGRAQPWATASAQLTTAEQAIAEKHRLIGANLGSNREFRAVEIFVRSELQVIDQ